MASKTQHPTRVDPFRRPDFFIIGAPRCGTTALSAYLSEHPNICFSRPKESQFFATDMPAIRYVSTLDEYLRKCFGHCRDCTTEMMLGEGSVWYLYSSVAVENILQFNPTAKIVIMLRNPIDMLPSLHVKYLESLTEDEPSFERAWRLQDARLRGIHVPRYCRDVRLLAYRDVGQLGRQLKRVFGIVPASQRHIIVFDDFIRETKRIYEEVLSFLGLETDGRLDFPVVNESVLPKSLKLWTFANYPPERLMRVVAHGKKLLGISELGVLPALRKKLLKPADKNFSSDLRTEMEEIFRDDVSELRKLIGKKLEGWPG